MFTAWTCVEFTVDSIAEPRTSIAFLREDLSLTCRVDVGGTGQLTAEYTQVLLVAYVFVGIWAVGMPLTYSLLMLKCRAAFAQRRSSMLVSATAFLHREYRSQYYAWEALFLIQRLVIVGFVQWIPYRLTFLRLLAALLVTFSYMVALLLCKPYKRRDIDQQAIATQVPAYPPL